MNRNFEKESPAASENRLLQRRESGQSVWLDFTSRELIDSGDLGRLIELDGISGMTSNPAIFEKAISKSDLYDEEIRGMAFHGRSPVAIYEALARTDLQRAADEFRVIYDRTSGRDGYVSLEVNPHLAHDTNGTIAEARRLWRALDRPNVFIKVPATAEGVPAIRELTLDGINVNVTLLFGLPRYRQVAEAYATGIYARLQHGLEVRNVRSVASFFISRIDTAVDARLEKAIAENQKGATAGELRGQVAIASAIKAREICGELFAGPAFQQAAARGARAQTLLWASTSVKNPAFPPLKYVEALLFPDTISTDTLATIEAFRERGNARVSRFDPSAAAAILERLAVLGIEIDGISGQLEEEGVVQFNEAFDRLIAVLKDKSALARPKEQKTIFI
jgi:transaldolase